LFSFFHDLTHPQEGCLILLDWKCKKKKKKKKPQMVQSVGMIDEYEDTKVNDYFSEL
jgi:hypothetical protein